MFKWVMIQGELPATSMTISMPKAIASTLFISSGAGRRTSPDQSLKRRSVYGICSVRKHVAT